MSLQQTGNKFLFPFILVTSLFFLWGFAHSILDVLNKHFQDALEISKTGSAMVQAVVYGAYFFMALPAGWIIRRFGYRTGVICGLLLYGIGALMFIPGQNIMSFGFFLLCLAVIGCGLTCLETAANPYVTELGDKSKAAQRINLSQSFNGLGWILGPLVGSLLILGDDGGDISTPYAIIGVTVLCIALLFSRVPLPEIKDTEAAKESGNVSLWSHHRFTFGVLALFFYVAAQTGINSFFINYVIEEANGITAQQAGLFLSFGGMGLFVVGRVGGSWIMQRIKAEKVLKICATGAVIVSIVVICGLGTVSVGALALCYLFESIMFPTIFAIAIQGLSSEATKKASPYLIMSIVGGAIAPVIMGYIGDHSNMAVAFFVPLVCFAYILFYTVKYCKTKQ